jgi:hypothetical protein
MIPSSRRGGVRLALLVGAAAATTVLFAPLAAATPGGTLAAATPAGTSSGALFGPMLTWSSDDAQTYAERLGATPGFYGETLGYPLLAADSSDLAVVAQDAAAHGASVLLQLDPRVALTVLTAEQAGAFAQRIQDLTTSRGTHFLVDFAPDMNGSWEAWGQQPRSYVAAFQMLAAAVHRTAPSAVMVWDPSNGAGYPFGTARGATTPSGPRVLSQLDTNGDGTVDERDDPYAPYWPGTASVDRVGLSVFWYGPPTQLGTNASPPAGWFEQSLTGAVGYSSPTGAGRDFVQQYSVDEHKPLLVETGALFVPSTDPGPGQSAILQDWIDQVFSPSVRARFPTLDAVMWLEQSRSEAESAGAVVDWRATGTTASATALRSALASAGFDLGPVPTTGGRNQADAAVTQVYQPTGSAGSQSDRVLVSVLILLGIFLVAGAAGRRRRAWRYPARDGRIDLLRGFVIAAVVVTHIEVGGPWAWFVVRAGALTGAEMFVLLSGIVLGSSYPRIVARYGEWAAGRAMVRRAGRLYLATVAVILGIYFLSRIPGIDSTSVTTFTDRGTGETGPGAIGRVYYLYGTASHLLDYPPPFFAVRDLLLLRYGPWPINIMGLFVVLSLAVPAAMWLVRRGLWWLLLAVSWGLYALNAVHPVQLFDAQFELVFPLFTWQIAFTHGLVVGRYRERIVAALTSRAGKITVAAGLVAYSALLLAMRAGASIPLVPSYDSLYTSWYERTNLEGGRLVDLAVSAIVVYALLTTCWRPLHASIGRFFEPLGRSSLTVFFIQVFVVLAVGNIHHLDRHSAWEGFLVQTVALALIWAIVRGRSPKPGPVADEPARPIASPLDVPVRAGAGST